MLLYENLIRVLTLVLRNTIARFQALCSWVPQRGHFVPHNWSAVQRPMEVGDKDNPCVSWGGGEVARRLLSSLGGMTPCGERTECHIGSSLGHEALRPP